MKKRFGLMILAILLSMPSAFAQVETRVVSIGLNAPGKLLITTADGSRLGEDPITGKQFTEIKDARQSTSRNREPVYVVPVSAGKSKLTLLIAGRDAVSEPDLGVSGPGFTLRLVGLRLSKTQLFRVEFDAFGPRVSVRASAAFSPEVRIAVDPEDDSPSYILSVRRGRIAAGRAVSVSYDRGLNRFEFSDGARSGASYAIGLTTISADGTEREFSEPALKSEGRNRFRIELGNPKNDLFPCVRSDSKRTGFGGTECRPLKKSP